MSNFEEIERFKKMNLSQYQVRQLFPNVTEHDIGDVVKLLNDKLESLKIKVSTYHHPSSLSFPTVDGMIEEFKVYIKELAVEYDTFGLKEKYNKIKRVLEVIPENFEHKYDLEIIKEIKKEYIETKKINKSSMLYLNKIYRQLTKETKETKENADVENKKRSHAARLFRQAMGVKE